MNFNYTTKGGGNAPYTTPAVEVLDIATEKGFANSPTGIIDYSDPGSPSTGDDENSLGEF